MNSINKHIQSFGLVVALLLIVSMMFSSSVFASGGGENLKSMKVDMKDKESLKRGARAFTTYCLSCHGAKFVRFNRVAEDLGMTEKEVMTELNHLGVKFGSPMEVTMDPAYAKGAFGQAPPDLSLVARSRGVNWLYTYLTSFYVDEKKKTGFNNALFRDVAMPNVLWQLQGKQHIDENGHLHLAEPGTMNEAEFDNYVKDLVSFLSYMGEPRQAERKTLGFWVLVFLFVLFVLVYSLKREFWKDIPH